VEKSLRVVRLLEPEMCDQCNHGGLAVITIRGERQVVIKCRRLDCDNWDYSQIEEGSEMKPLLDNN